MGILDEDVARVRAETDFVQLASEHVALKKVGRRWTGLCPFHAEKSPSFSVNAEEGLYYCFGCQARGDVITFVREVEHLDFVEAVERLAARANIQLRYDDAAASKDRQRRGTAARRHGEGGRLVPPAAADGARRRARPATTCARAATTATSCASSSWAGRRTTGTRWPRRSGPARRRPHRHRARLRQPPPAASRTPSGAG